MFKTSVLKMAQRSILTILFSLMLTSSAFAIGIIVPREPEAAAPRLKSVEVDAKITDHISRTRIIQVFYNPNSRPVEADFFFPVPNGADITDFVLYMNGKPVKGEVLDKEKAHDIYRDIVRKLRDPGLVEWADKNLFRVRVFPIPAKGDQKLEIEISQPLTADQGYFRYFLPIESRPAAKSETPTPVSLKVQIQAESPIRNIYSPTHELDTDKANSKSVTVTAKGDFAAQHKDFILYYEPSEKNISASLLTHRTGSDDGYFALRISPPWDQATTAPEAHGGDYVFVIDTSGSMADGDKISQAQKALRYCVGLLGENDRFNLIRFSTTVESYNSEMVQATESNRKASVAWIEELQARGGTNIAGALEAAIKQRNNAKTTDTADSMFTVVFLTDGLPTVGETSSDAIIKTVEDASGGNVRVFTFGVGHDVNTRLLDSIADQTRAASDYVAPEADLEVPVSRFFDKVSRPALFNLELNIPGAGVTEVYPPQLPDLFYGTELAVYGKYSKPTTSPIILTGTMAGQKQEFRFEKLFPKAAGKNAFVEKLWATRKVAWLLDQVRKTGESDELQTEIKQLAEKYSIVTPYTSYLAMEDERHQPSVVRSQPQQSIQRYYNDSRPGLASRAVPAAGSGRMATDKPALDLQSESGAVAVKTARQLQRMKSADIITGPANSQAGRKTVHGKSFVLENGTWKDTAIMGSELNTIKVQYLSEAWFQISEEFPEIRDFFALGETVHVRVNDNTVLQVGQEGIDFIDVKTKQLLSQQNSNNN